MDGDDKQHLPPDLDAMGRRVRDLRTELSPVELDALWQRTTRRLRHHDAPRRQRLARLPRPSGNALALMLSVGLLLSAGGSAVVAASGVLGSTSTSSLTQPADAGECEYEDSYSSTYTGTSTKGRSAATMTVTVYCTTTRVCIESTKDISNYQFDNAEKVDLRHETNKLCLDIPRGAQTLRTKAGTTNHTFSIKVA